MKPRMVPQTKVGGTPAAALKIAGNVIAAKLIKQVKPEYPPDDLSHQTIYLTGCRVPLFFTP